MFDLRAADQEKVQRLAEAELKQSSNTLGIFVCRREGNPHYRHHYSMIGNLSRTACAAMPVLAAMLERFLICDTKFDPITGKPYVLPWGAASNRAAKNSEKG